MVDMATRSDGTVVLHPRGVLGTDNADELRRVVVHTIRHLRPARLLIDLSDVDDLDPINLGALAAACEIGDDHHVAVLIDHSSPAIAARFIAAGVAAERLRLDPSS